MSEGALYKKVPDPTHSKALANVGSGTYLLGDFYG